MASAGETCDQCWAGALQLHEGMLVCDVCGSIQQGFAEETQEYQIGISDARFFKKSEGMKSKAAGKAAAEEPPPPPPPVAEAVRAYVRAIQQLLQRQAQALVTSFGMDPALPAVLRELWLAFLAHSRLLEPATIKRLEALAEPGAAAALSDDELGSARGGSGGSDGGEGDNRVQRSTVASQMTHGRRALRIQHELAPMLHMRHTLELLLLACWQLGEAASPLDVSRWALDGRLPYLSFAADEGTQLAQFRTILGPDFITVKGVPAPNFLLTHAAQLAARLGLACPPLSPALWLQRYLAELELPQARGASCELLPVALQLHTLYHPAPLVPTHAARLTRHAWAQLMATLVLTVKLCYGLDVAGGRSLAGLPPPPGWHDWAQRQLSRLSSVSAFPLSLREAAQLEGPPFQTYLQYLQQGLLASFQPPPNLETVHQLFQRLALPQPPPPPQQQGGNGGTGGSGGTEVGGMQGLSAGRGDRGQAHVPALAAAAGQPGEHGGEQPGEERRVQAAYRFSGAGVQHKGTAHADYALLLAACAAPVWLVPEALHELVAGLEQGLIAAECEVSFQYNSREQARLARVRAEGAWQRQQEAEEERRQQLEPGQAQQRGQPQGRGRQQRRQREVPPA